MSYYSKSIDSFNTRKRFFIFDYVINGKKDFYEEDFIRFQITDNLIKLFTAEYFQIEGAKRLKSIECRLTVNEIYAAMNKFEQDHSAAWKTLEKRYFMEVFKALFPEDFYNKLMKEKACYYCGITLDEISALADEGKLFKKNERGWTFEIDRKKPNQEYTKDNCVATCYWCNNAKTDEFDDKEFKPIGELIGKTLKVRLNK